MHAIKRLPNVGGIHGNSLKLLLSSVVVGIGNYGFSLALVWLLPSGQFSHVASATALLLVVGTASASMLPWVVARAVSRSAPGSRERHEAIQFALLAALFLGAFTGAVVAALAAPYAPLSICVMLVVTSTALFISGAASGYQIGEGHYSLLAVLSVTEVAIKLGAGIGLVLVGGGATGAFAGSTLGALTWCSAGLWFMRREASLAWRRPPLHLLRQLAGVGSSQVLVTSLATMDVVIGSIVIGGASGFASYQTMLVFARIPTFVATSLSSVVYPRLASAQDGQSRAISESSSLYLCLAIVIAVVVATVPGKLLGIFLPAKYLHSLGLLLPLTLAGVAAGQLNLSTTFLQAHLAFKSMLKVLVASIGPIVLIYALAGTSDGRLAWSAAGCLSVVALVIYLFTADRYGSARLGTKILGYSAAFIVALYILREAKAHLVLWLLCAAASGVLALIWARPRPRAPGPLRVLFLIASEGLPASVRRSISSFQEALVLGGAQVTAAFSQTENGSRGVTFDHRFDELSRGHWYSSALRVLLALTLVQRYKPDLVVEELGGPPASRPLRWSPGPPVIAIAPERPGRPRNYIVSNEFSGHAQVLLWLPNGRFRPYHSRPDLVAPAPEINGHPCPDALDLWLSACRHALSDHGLDPKQYSL